MGPFMIVLHHQGGLEVDVGCRGSKIDVFAEHIKIMNVVDGGYHVIERRRIELARLPVVLFTVYVDVHDYIFCHLKALIDIWLVRVIFIFITSAQVKMASAVAMQALDAFILAWVVLVIVMPDFGHSTLQFPRSPHLQQRNLSIFLNLPSRPQLFKFSRNGRVVLHMTLRAYLRPRRCFSGAFW